MGERSTPAGPLSGDDHPDDSPLFAFPADPSPISLGCACGVDSELLAAICGPKGLGGEALSAAFGQDKAADVLRPSPVLAALTAQAVSNPASLTDNELIGALRAACRMANQAASQQVMMIAEFARRRQTAFEAAKARGVPVGCRDGEFPGEELTIELVTTPGDAAARIDAAIDLTTRLPRTLAAMTAGTIDAARASTIAFYTRGMGDADAAHADAVLAAAASGLRHDQLSRKAAALELKLAPEAVAARKKLARQLGQRVEARREESGNASLSGRELDTADVIASKAYIDAIAGKLRNSGLIEGSIGRLRALALTDLTQGRNPLDRISPESSLGGKPLQPATDRAGGQPLDEFTTDPSGRVPEPAAETSDEVPECVGEFDDSLSHDPPGHGDPVPLPALINLLVPAGTLLGWGTAPALAGGWGLLDADETKALVEAAAQHPRTRWCMTIVAPDGTAIAHGCANGQHPWPGHSPPPPPRNPPNPRSRSDQSPPLAPGRTDASRSPQQAVQLLDLLHRLNVALEPIARDACDHRHAEDRYVPSRKLRHLLHARNQTCTAPACNAQAVYCDIDHTDPYPDGATDECNTNPKCRRHHRTKQAPGWKVVQPTPGTTAWTTPSGRSHTTTPTVYDL